MIILKIFIVAIGGILWRMGGSGNWRPWFRDVLIPIILGGYVILSQWSVWGTVAGILTAGSFQIIRIGYGAYDPENDSDPSWLASITHDRQGWINRGIAGLLYGLVGLIPLMVYWRLQLGWWNWKLYLVYSLILCFVSALLCRMKARDIIIEPAIGAAVLSLVLFI